MTIIAETALCKRFVYYRSITIICLVRDMRGVCVVWFELFSAFQFLRVLVCVFVYCVVYVRFGSRFFQSLIVLVCVLVLGRIL